MSFNRQEQFKKLADSYDICVIGGGATGAGVALDATLRGYKVIVIDKGDFASQTSSKSTKLVHGGVRYLEQAVRNLDWQQFKMVYKALHERKTMLQNAPHLAHPLALLTPCYSWFDRAYYRIGMWLYDKIAGSTNLMDSRGLNKKEIHQEVPALNLKKIVGGILYYDGQMNDARYALSILQEAEKLGATVLNYAELSSFTSNSTSLKIDQVHGRDLIGNKTFQFHVRAVVNATGPFTDKIRKLANPNLLDRMKVSRGAHIVLPMNFWPGDTALLIPKTDDGRVVFLLPWQGSVLVGTTDDADELSENPVITQEEQTYLLEYFNRFALGKAKASDIKAGFVGLRPLLQAQIPTAVPGDTKSLVRDHEVEVDQRSNLISIMGGKWTTYRIMAEDTLDIVETDVFHIAKTPCLTKNHPIMGGDKFDFESFVKTDFMTFEIRQHLYKTYGSKAPLVIEFCRNLPQGTEVLLAGQPYLQGEIEYMKQHEMSTCWADVIDRRWGIGLRDEDLGRKLMETKKEAFASIS